MGVGKSTLAAGLATALARPHLDSDRAIEAATGVTGRQIAQRHGVDALHDLEIAVLLHQLGSDRPSVVSAAASVVESPAARAALDQPTVVWLDLPVEDLLVRMATGTHRRSISRQRVEELDARRRPHLLAIADHRLDARSSPSDLAATTMRLLGSV